MNTYLSTNRKFSRMLVNILSIFVILAMAIPVTGSASAEGPAPSIRISTSNNYLRADNFAPSTTVTFTVYPTQNSSEEPLWSDTRVTDENGFAIIWPWEQPLDLVIGNYVVATDETNEKQLVLEPLTIDVFDPDMDFVAGTAPAGRSVWVVVGNDTVGYPATMLVDANADGEWVADFALVYDFTEDMWGSAELYDDDGDATVYHKGPPPPPPNPRFTVFPEWEWFDGYDWPDGATVDITVQDKPECATQAASSGNFFNGGFPESCDITVGDMVTFTAGETIRMHTVRNLAVTAVDEEADTVSGTSEPFETVYVWQHEPGEQIPVVANEYGEWLADLSEVYNIHPGSSGRSEIRDEAGNATAVDWNAPEPPPNPFIAVSLTEHWFWVNHFAPETLVTFSIYENQGDESPILEFSKPTDALGNLTIEGCEHIWDPEQGDYIVATDGVNTKDLVLEYLTLDVFDPANDFVSGHALPGREIGVGVGNETGEQWMNVLADESTGLWVADFTLEGFKFDITEDSWAGGHVNDEDGDVTAAHNSGPPEPPAWFTVFPEWDAIEGWNFPLGAVVHLAIDDPTTPNSPDYEQNETVTFTPWGSWELWVWFDVAGMYDLKAGDIVTLTYGGTIRTHTVQNLAVTKVDPEEDIVKGIADDGANVNVWPHATGQEQLVIANPRGRWNVDFTGIYDLEPGDGGRARIWDEMGNATEVDWFYPSPRIVASITEDWFYLQEFSPDATLAFTVYEAQAGKPIWKGTATTDGSGFAWIDAQGRWNLEPGSYLVVKDGSNSKDLIIEGFTFDVFDLTQGILQGTVTGQEGRRVWAGIGFENDSWSMDIFTDADGNWLADFDAPVPSDYQWVAAQIFDADGDASEMRPTSQIIFLRPLCGDTYTVQAGSLLEIRYGSWVAIGEDLTRQNAEHLTINLELNGETVTGVQQPVVAGSEIPCGVPPEDAYGVFYVTQVGPLSTGTHVASVTWILDEQVTDGFDADGDGEPDWYGPGEVFTHEFMIIVQ